MTHKQALVAALVAVLALVLAGCAAKPARTVVATGSGASRAEFRGSGFAACPAPAGGRVSGRDTLPGVSLTCMDGSGKQYTLDRPTGTPMVVNLWGSWCPPCGKELPAFQRLATDARGKLTVLGVVTEDSAAASVAAARDLHLTFANLYDRQGAVRRALGRSALPVTVFVDAHGRITHLYNAEPLDDETLRLLVEKYLGVVLA